MQLSLHSSLFDFLSYCCSWLKLVLCAILCKSGFQPNLLSSPTDAYSALQLVVLDRFVRVQKFDFLYWRLFQDCCRHLQRHSLFFFDSLPCKRSMYIQKHTHIQIVPTIIHTFFKIVPLNTYNHICVIVISTHTHNPRKISLQNKHTKNCVCIFINTFKQFCAY